MAIPDYQAIMLPFLKIAEAGKEHSKKDTTEKLANQFNLTEFERRELLQSGKQEVFDNRVGWARTYLKKAGLIQSNRRGYFSITSRGTELLKQNQKMINNKILKQYPEFRTYKKDNKSETPIDDEPTTPQENLYNAYQRINDELAKDILEKIKSELPSDFEHIVIDLLVKMGYGGSYKDAAQAIGKSGDEGVDGVINQDTLGIDRIYVQAKRWNDKSVGHPEIRDFIGALDFKHCDRGIFITTSTFTKSVQENLDRSSKRIILIDGDELARLMITHNVGVTIEETLQLKKVDMDYFVEE
jgi:restriction system protein